MACRIKNRELVFDVFSSTAFTSDCFPINPGLSPAFPWLSSIAGNYQEYRFHTLKYVYESRAGDIVVDATNTSLNEGVVIMAVEYNSALFNPFSPPGTIKAYNSIPGVFASKQQMENSEGAVSGRPQENRTLVCQSRRTRAGLDTRYVRQTLGLNGADPRVYDLGIFQISTVGAPGGGAPIGSLFVEYDITLLKPVYSTNLPAMDIFSIPAAQTSVTSMFGTGGYQYGAGNSTLGGVIAGTNITDTYPSNPQCEYVFPPTARAGVYRVTYSVRTDASAPASITSAGSMGLITFGTSNITAFNTANGLEPLQILQPDPNDVASSNPNFKGTTISMITYLYWNGALSTNSNRNANAFGLEFFHVFPGVITGTWLIVEECCGTLIQNGALTPAAS